MHHPAHSDLKSSTRQDSMHSAALARKEHEEEMRAAQ